MENSTYKRKTSNPKMAWSEERRAEFSAQCKKAHADGTWHKKSKKAVSKAISNGKKEAIKFKNRSMAQKKSWAKRKQQKEADFFSAENISKRLNSRKGKEQEAIMNHPPTTLSENLLDKAVLPAEEEVTIEVKEKKTPDLPSRVMFPQPYEKWDKEQFGEFASAISCASGVLEQAEKALGVRPTLHSFLLSAINDRLNFIYETMGFLKEEDE